MITLGIGRGKGRLMRWVVCAAVAFGIMLGLTPNAFAGDFDVLRGSQSVGPATFTRWSGVYVGGHVSRGGADMDFTNASQHLLAKLLNNIDVETQFNISKWPVGERTYNPRLKDPSSGVCCIHKDSPRSASAASRLCPTNSDSGAFIGVSVQPLPVRVSRYMLPFSSLSEDPGLPAKVAKLRTTALLPSEAKLSMDSV